MEVITVTPEQLKVIIKASIKEALAERDRVQNDLPEYLTREQVMNKLSVSREVFRQMLDRDWLNDVNTTGRKNKIDKRSFIETRARVEQIRKQTNRQRIMLKDII